MRCNARIRKSSQVAVQCCASAFAQHASLFRNRFMQSTNPLHLPLVQEFQAIWQSGKRPDIAEFLSRVPLEQREKLASHIVPIDVDFLIRSGQEVSWAHYCELVRDFVENPAQWVQNVSAITLNASPDADTSAELGTHEVASLVPGMRFGRYEISARLGGGGMGTVYRAFDTTLHREVAVKVPHLHYKNVDEKMEIVQRFYREARAMATLSHPNICQVYDVGCIQSVHFLTMAYVKGQALAERISSGPVLTIEECLTIVRKVALGLHSAHQKQLIHRDLKPANIMLSEALEPIVIDFGIARQTQATEGELQTVAGAIVGTPNYMSPEQVRGEHSTLTCQSDVFTLGVILYQLLTSQLPFQGRGLEVLALILSATPPAPSSINIDVPKALDDLVLRMLAKEPAGRPVSMLEVAHAIDQLIQNKADRGLVHRQSRTTFSAGREYDIFVSYAPGDNHPFGSETNGWVTSLLEHVEWRMCQLHGRGDEISVCPCNDPLFEMQSDLCRFLKSQLIVIVDSPGYANSVWYRPELSPFREFVLSKQSRGEVLLIERDTHFDASRRLVGLENAPTIKLWQQHVGGEIEILSPSSRDSGRYFGKVDDLARRLVRQLYDTVKITSEPTKEAGAALKVTNSLEMRVYLAEVTDDLECYRDEVSRYLEQANVVLVPQSWYPRDRESFLTHMEADLKAADIFVQLLGPVVGKRVPGTEQSYAQLQHQHALKLGKPMMQWRMPGPWLTDIQDSGHRTFLNGSEVQCVTLEEFKRSVFQQLQKSKTAELNVEAVGASDKFLFVNFDHKDSESVRHLCELLDKVGMSYALPLRDGLPQEIGEDLEANFIDCDALIIYYGEVSEKWVREQLRMWRKVLHRREKPVQALAIFEGPPDPKTPLGMKLPNLESIDLRQGFNQQQVLEFLRRLA